jgi:signal transduction histidine kinase
VNVRSEHPKATPSWALILIDVAAVGVLFVVGIVEMRAVGDDIFFRSFDVWALMLVALQTLPAALRRIVPLPALAVCVVAQVTALLVGYPPTNALLAIPLALYSVAYTYSRRTTVAITVSSVVLFLPWELTDAPGTTQLVLLTAVIFGAAALAGDGSKARRLYAATIEERARQVVERRETEMREAVVEERARIARELHDAVGHTVNVLVVHAGAGRVAAGQDPQRAAQALGEIESIGRAALTDIDRLLGLLRQDGVAGRQPTQGIGDVPALVERIRTTGVDVELTAPADLPRIPVATGAAAFRIVQEALTNVIKHAGPAKVRVVIEVDGDLRLSVEDDGRGAAAERSADTGRIGRGLIGMRERATLLGGELTAGPRPGGGYRVAAQLPLPESDAIETESAAVVAAASTEPETAT